MLKYILLFSALIFSSFGAHAQVVDDTFAWTFIKVQGKFDADADPNTWSSKFVGAFEYHYRLNENVSEYQNMIFRPMLGYILNDNGKVWVGYAYFEKNTDQGIVREQRLFQMLTYNSDTKKPVVFVGRTKIEERFFEESDIMAMRFRQMLGVAVDLFKVKETQVMGYLTNEIHIGMNVEKGAAPSFNQNRVLLGVGVKTQIAGRGVTFKAGYLNITAPNNQMTHGFSVGASINLNKKKKNRKKKF
jgi:hypothetical protein